MYGFMDNYFGNVGRRNGLFEQFGMPYGNRQYGGQQQPGNQNGPVYTTPNLGIGGSFNPQPRNMGFNQPQNPGYSAPQNEFNNAIPFGQNPNIGHNNPLTPSFGGARHPGMRVALPGIWDQGRGWTGGSPNFNEQTGERYLPGDPRYRNPSTGFGGQSQQNQQPGSPAYNWFKAMQGG